MSESHKLIAEVGENAVERLEEEAMAITKPALDKAVQVKVVCNSSENPYPDKLFKIDELEGFSVYEIVASPWCNPKRGMLEEDYPRYWVGHKIYTLEYGRAMADDGSSIYLAGFGHKMYEEFRFRYIKRIEKIIME